VIYRFDAELWLWDARESWTFLSLPEEASDEIREVAAAFPRAFRSVKVTATIGTTTWRTSIFPGAGGVYVLPLKKPVRQAEGIEAGDTATVRVELDA
jgi:hypothetical protein